MDKYNTEGENIKYKVGDIVTVLNNLEEVNAARQEAGKDTWPDVTDSMLKYSGKSFKITSVSNAKRLSYKLGNNAEDYDYNWASWMLTSGQCSKK